MKPMNFERLSSIILHCTASAYGKDLDVSDIRNMHLDRGWSDVGYHYLIQLDGTIQKGRELHYCGAHTRGHNNSVGIAYVGGLGPDNKTPQDTMTTAQEEALYYLVRSLRLVFGQLELTGHNDYANKACPSFKVSEKFPDANDWALH